MVDRPNPRNSARKQPKRARLTEPVATFLKAAIQVLANKGAAFAATRVAEKQIFSKFHYLAESNRVTLLAAGVRMPVRFYETSLYDDIGRFRAVQ